jgi:hypothetical protein
MQKVSYLDDGRKGLATFGTHITATSLQKTFSDKEMAATSNSIYAAFLRAAYCKFVSSFALPCDRE